MDGGGILLVVMAVLAACLLLVVGLAAFHRFAGAGAGGQAVPCCYRPAGEEDWRKGSLRYDRDRLDHYGPGGLSVRPEHRWLRAGLDLGVARAAVEGECTVLPAGHAATTVTCTYGDHRFELSLGHEHYTALRSWLESMPPGYNANVA